MTSRSIQLAVVLAVSMLVLAAGFAVSQSRASAIASSGSSARSRPWN